MDKKRVSWQMVSVILGMVSIVLGLLALSFGTNYYDLKNNQGNVLIGSSGSEINSGTKIEGDLTLDNSVANFGHEVTAVGSARIRSYDGGFSIESGSFQKFPMVVKSEDDEESINGLIFITPDCQLGVINEISPLEEVIVGSCEYGGECYLYQEYQFARNAQVFDVSGGSLFVGIDVEEIISSEGSQHCSNQI